MFIDGSEKDKTAKEVIEAIDVEKKSITWKVIGGDLLELYNSLMLVCIITSCEGEWTKCTFVYEKKTEDTPEPLVPFGLLLNLLKDRGSSSQVIQDLWICWLSALPIYLCVSMGEFIHIYIYISVSLCVSLCYNYIASLQYWLVLASVSKYVMLC
ncbi:putative kirola-like [Capsicum annuum]|uniref:Bet v I/Major latex protein domain-containing protein n=1 Tax=Capsicum annuum TaxID=4072 RepID=A0A2G2ZHC6_CAPAN|nr:putative kirola-like [Capsicum annuum]KAF3622858.1 putative kirola-like [Capsicum annuum]PHT81407.1 hypothetical protein T459_14422 [Capsicum annuum]